MKKKYGLNFNYRENKSLPSHATLGAAYLWKILPDGLRDPLSFAFAIHHTEGFKQLW